MNTWLLSASTALVGIGAVHSVLGEMRIFLPWRTASPQGLPPRHQIILRASWHLPTLLGLGQAATHVSAAAADGAQPWRMLLGALGLSVAACGALVALATRGRHPGGTALLVAALLIGMGMRQGAGV
jgi:hypothetical protein